MGVENIMAVDGNPQRLEFAAKLGATRSVNFMEHKGIEALVVELQRHQLAFCCRHHAISAARNHNKGRMDLSFLMHVAGQRRQEIPDHRICILLFGPQIHRFLLHNPSCIPGPRRSHPRIAAAGF